MQSPLTDKDLLAQRERLELILSDKPTTTTHASPKSYGLKWTSFTAGLLASSFLFGAIYYGQPILHSMQKSLAVAPAVFANAYQQLTNPGSDPQIAQAAQTAVLVPINHLPAPFSLPINQIRPATALTQIAGLSAARSVLTGVLDPRTLTASYYWTFVVSNTSSRRQEAVLNVALPKNAAVTRATLWVNGVPQEAAFTSRQAAQQAYDWIATTHRDPLLVTQIKEGEVELKASPVMPGQNMEFRIGITAPLQQVDANQAQLDLPRIVDSNLETKTPVNLHLTSTSPLFASSTGATVVQQSKGFLLRANVSSDEMKTIAITMPRVQQLQKFAVRATHSFPAAYIEAVVEPFGELSLTKTPLTPECPIITDQDASFRLSNIWARREIQQLVNDGRTAQAIELASIYRVVSPVSGATVLERDSDYTAMGLNRNMYRSMAYASASRRAKTEAAEAKPQPSPSSSPSPSPSFAPLFGGSLAGTFGDDKSVSRISDATSAPVLSGATSGTIGPSGMDATYVTPISAADRAALQRSSEQGNWMLLLILFGLGATIIAVTYTKMRELAVEVRRLRN